MANPTEEKGQAGKEAGKDAKKKSKKPTPLKRAQQDQKKRMHNRAAKASVHTAVSSLKSSAELKQHDLIPSKLNLLYSLVDKATKKGVIKKQSASRIKSRVAAFLASFKKQASTN
jgi:small subunit ribosomal protein S20